MKVLLYLYLYIWMASTRLIYDCSSMLPTHPPHVLGFCSMYFVLSSGGFPQYSIMNGCVEQTSLWMCLNHRRDSNKNDRTMPGCRSSLTIFCPATKHLLQNRMADVIETLYTASGTQIPPNLFNDVPRLTFDLFMQRSNVVPYAFVWENALIVDFSETVAVVQLVVFFNSGSQWILV